MEVPEAPEPPSSSSVQASSMELLAGSGRYGFADGAGIAAQFHYPKGIAVDGDGNILVADMINHRVRRIAPCGTVSTVAGGRQGYGASGAARFNGPQGIAVDGEGNIFVLDTWNRRVRKITPNGIVSTLAGTGRNGYADGAGASAQFFDPYGVAVDGEGNAIVSDFNRVRKITPDGAVSTCFASSCEKFLGVAIDAHGCVVVIRDIVKGNWSHPAVAKIMGCSLAPPCAAEQKRGLAFCMLSHERLGRDSIWAGLKQELLQMVLGKH